MINDFVKLFQRAYDEYGDKIILDNYTLAEGLYIRVNKDNTWDSMAYRRDSDQTGCSDLHNWFKSADYYSQLVDINKSVDPDKKIHSNNYLSFFIKKDILPDIGEPEKRLNRQELMDSIERYFGVFCKTNKDKQTMETLARADLEDIIHQKVNQNKKYLLEQLDRLLEFIRDNKLSKKDYVKVFFNDDFSVYQLESKRYLIPKIFNKNDYNIFVDSEVYGLSNSNMGMNAKKPYLEAKTTKFKVPFRICIESAIAGKKVLDWLESQNQNEVYIPVDYDFKRGLGDIREKKPFFYFYCTNKKSFVIEDFDYLPMFDDKIDFTLFNFLEIEEGEKENRYIIAAEEISKLYEFESKVDGYLFNGRLKRSYYQEPKVKTNEFSKALLDLLIISRKAFHDYFKKGIDKGIKSLIDRVSLEAVKEQLKMCEGTSVTKAAKAMNLRLSLLKHLKTRREHMGDKLQKLMHEISDKINSDALTVCENDDEFYFLAGQIAYYMLYQSEAAKKTHGLAEPYLRTKNACQLKKQLSFTYDKYKHAISFNFKKFNNAMAAVQGYQTEVGLKENQDMFLAGFMANNIFLTKTN